MGRGSGALDKSDGANDDDSTPRPLGGDRITTTSLNNSAPANGNTGSVIPPLNFRNVGVEKYSVVVAQHQQLHNLTKTREISRSEGKNLDLAAAGIGPERRAPVQPGGGGVRAVLPPLNLKTLKIPEKPTAGVSVLAKEEGAKGAESLGGAPPGGRSGAVVSLREFDSLFQ